ncbi:MAG: hypothetical protein ACK4UQ_00705 [Brevundimonas sp.]
MTCQGRQGVAILAAGLAMAGTAHAQAVQRAEVLGTWTLRLTPAEDGSVTISTRNGRLDMPVSISARGALAITLRMDDARMTYTLNGRRNDGFTGAARISYRLIPFGSMHLGTASLTPRGSTP